MGFPTGHSRRTKLSDEIRGKEPAFARDQTTADADNHSQNSAWPVMRHLTFVSLLLAATLLSGCDMLGDSSEKVAAAKDAEGRAIGGACRHAGRAIEDCYALNKKADKAAVFAGWRDMNDYMRENKIDSVAPQLMAQRPESKSAEKPLEKSADGKPAADAATDAPEKRPAKPGSKAREPKEHGS